MGWQGVWIATTVALTSLHAAATAQAVPTTQQIFARYVSAAGGEAAIRGIRSRESVGQLVAPGGRAPLVILQVVPDRFLRILDSPVSGRSENGYDGRTAWSRNSAGVREITGPVVDQFRREYDLHRPLALPTYYLETRVDTATLEGRPQFVVTAETTDHGTETLYFDRATGLMTGWDETIAGTLLRTRLGDYRPVDGVQVPFRVTRSRPGFTWTEEMRSVNHNVAVDSTRFLKPQPEGVP